MPIRVYLTILFIIFIASSTSVGILYMYMDPLNDPPLALTLMGSGLLLGISSFLSMTLFFMKKIYYRGDVYLGTMHASIRQSLLIASGGILMLALYKLQIYEPRLIWTVWLTIGCIEVLSQAIE